MVASRKGGLGKGLSALFEDIEIGPADVRDPELSGHQGDNGLIYLDIHEMSPNSRQPRKHFDEEKIRELADSIEIHGILQPIMCGGPRRDLKSLPGNGDGEPPERQA